MSAAFATTDLCDANEARLSDGTLQVAAPGFVSFGGAAAFKGPAATLRVPDDNVLVRKALEQPGEGRVLVVDGSACPRCALVGGNLAKLAQDHGWAGIVVNGYVRDAGEIDACRVGVRALGLMPRRSSRQGRGESGVVLTFAGVTVRPGDWIYADRDGWLVSGVEL